VKVTTIVEIKSLVNNDETLGKRRTMDAGLDSQRSKLGKILNKPKRRKI